MKRWRVFWGYKEDGVWLNDVAGCSYTVAASSEREARKQVRALLKVRTYATTKKILYVTEVTRIEPPLRC